MISGFYNNGMALFIKGSIDIENDTIKMALLDSGHSLDITNDYFSEVSGDEIAANGGYTSGGVTVSNLTVSESTDVVNVSANTVTINNFNAADVQYLVFYKDTGNPETSPLIWFIAYDTPVTYDYAILNVTLPSGVFKARSVNYGGYIALSAVTGQKSEETEITITPTLNMVSNVDTLIPVIFSGGHSQLEDYGVGKHFTLAYDDDLSIINIGYNQTVVAATIPAGETETEITLTVANNPTIEMDRAINISIPGFAPSRTITIVDDNRDDTYGYNGVVNVTNSAHVTAIDPTAAALDKTGTLDNSTNLQKIIDGLGNNPKVVLYFPDGTYRMELIQIYQGTTLAGQSKTGTILRRKSPHDTGDWYILLRNKAYNSSSDSDPIGLYNLTLDGDNLQKQDPTNEHSVLVYAAANIASPGKIKMRLEQLILQRNPASDGFFAGANVDSDLYEITDGSNDFYRGAIDLTGPHCVHKVRNTAVDYFHCEFDTVGYSEETDITIESLTCRAGIFATSGIYANSINSTMYINNVTVTESTHFAHVVGNTANNFNVFNSTFNNTLPSGSTGYCNNPGWMNFTNCVFIAKGKENTDYLSAFPTINFFQSSASNSGQRVNFHDCRWRADKGGYTMAAWAILLSNVKYIDYDNRVVITGDSEFESTLDGGFSGMETGGSGGQFYMNGGTMSVSCAASNTYPIKVNGHDVAGTNFTVHLENINWNSPKFMYQYGYTSGSYGVQNRVFFRNIAITKNQNVIDHFSGIGATTSGIAGGGTGVMRTIAGETGDNPVSSKPAGYCNGSSIYDRYYVPGTGNFKCTATGAAGSATWAAE